MASIEATPRTRAAMTRQDQQLSKFQKGKPERSLNRQDVLEEDEYIEALEKIIARDFFPIVSERLREREHEQQILAGFTSDDPEVIERSVRHMEHLAARDPAWSARISRRTVADTPRFAAGRATPSGRSVYGETPVATDPEEQRKARLRYDENLSLDNFHDKYTSEDNASFAQIMDDENAARRSRYSWAYKAEQKATDRATRAIEARTQLVDLSRRLAEGDGEIRLIEGSEAGRPGERLLIEGRTSLPGDKASVEYAKRRLIAQPVQERLLIVGPDGEKRASASDESASEGSRSIETREQELALALRKNKDRIDNTRKESEVGTGVTTWPFTARNNFYFAPDANIPIQESSRHSQAGPSKPGEDIAGVYEPKSIRYSSTRIADDADLNEQARLAGVPPSPSHSNIAAAISGTPYHGRSSMTPRVQGYSFVDAMPSPSPSEMGAAGANALMTFGTIAATPVALRGGDDDDDFKAPAPPRKQEEDDFEGGAFRIKAQGRREALAHKMASKASRSLSKGPSGGGGLGLLRMGNRMSATPGTPSAYSLTPKAAEGSSTPGRDAYLSPAARTLLGRANKGSTRQTYSPDVSSGRRKERDEREIQSHDRFKRQRWDPSPLRSNR